MRTLIRQRGVPDGCAPGGRLLGEPTHQTTEHVAREVPHSTAPCSSQTMAWTPSAEVAAAICAS
ncbi:hypothetical protein, partial [Salmonella sp. s51992]|uniref:hypothetical protein n=1 Tax=Salmonella sp. s51992 TaxID=3159657 RepID=UPI0039807D2D